MNAARTSLGMLVSICILATTACSFDGVNSIALPGNTSGGDTYRVTLDIEDVQNLVGNSPVKANNATVGNISSIKTDGWQARITLDLNADDPIPANVSAKLSQTSLFGSQFIDLTVPEGQAPQGRLSDGANIAIDRTDRYPAVEEVLSALSLVLNGAGLQQIRTITNELDRVVGGRETESRSLIKNLRVFVDGLADQRRDIERAIESVNRLGAELAAQTETIDAGIAAIEPALGVLDEQQKQLTQMLTSVGRFGDAATGIIRDSKSDIESNLADLAPTLNALADTGKDLPEALKIALTIPFPIATTARGIRGDYLNLFLTLDISVDTIANKVIPSVTRQKRIAPTPARQNADPLSAPLTPANSDDGGQN
ncbi:phospholipid/cholesterol/gamma-HCH transport system substrate-binding protein [Williamsia limnetica]|uniref:Phospholipid/cholesterol/gamma-HCH transport system substrate-binding protein n=1 Tax=Williamsia limnetica TaxID=882452 RepID=A0A318RED5_WILLI|nr:MCE family protein [Williamsia limnetica]PYE12361.1 phospholipid/cholesterol/gamma-HCH transport system substrate-binding protein [Williamsia limnetica]